MHNEQEIFVLRDYSERLQGCCPSAVMQMEMCCVQKLASVFTFENSAVERFLKSTTLVVQYYNAVKRTEREKGPRAVACAHVLSQLQACVHAV